MDGGMNVYNVLYLFVQWKEDLWPIFNFLSTGSLHMQRHRKGPKCFHCTVNCSKETPACILNEASAGP